MTGTLTSTMKRWAVLLVAAFIVAGMLIITPKLLNRSAALEAPVVGTSTSSPAEVDSMKWTRGTVNDDVVDCRRPAPGSYEWWVCPW